MPVCRRGLQVGGGGGQQRGSVAGERGIDAFAVDHALGRLGRCAAADDLGGPSPPCTPRRPDRDRER